MVSDFEFDYRMGDCKKSFVCGLGKIFSRDAVEDSGWHSAKDFAKARLEDQDAIDDSPFDDDSFPIDDDYSTRSYGACLNF